MAIEGFNWFDLLFSVFLVYFIFTSRSLIASLLDLVGFIFTLFISYRTYAIVGVAMTTYLYIPKGIAQAWGFFIVWFFVEAFLFIIVRIVLSQLPDSVHEHPVNRFFAFIPGAIQAFIFFMLITVTAFSLPIRPTIKQDIMSSRTGPVFVSFSNMFERHAKNVFGGAVHETLNFLTIRQNSSEGLSLGFKVEKSALNVDHDSEISMINLVNKERKDRGLRPLSQNEGLTEVARAYGKEMFVNGFFSHESKVDGSSPAQRVDRNGIYYTITGENLAYAPDVIIAHQGLMNSPGHRKNILLEDYGTVGIGVIDAGIYGKIFVQEFTD